MNRVCAQSQARVVAIGSYNVENFFDTLNDPKKNDEDFLPGGPYGYNSRVYNEKKHNVAKVFQQMGTDVTPDGCAIIGMVEVENDNVLRDLVQEPEIRSRNYKYVYSYTPDERGISVAMLYSPKYFTLINYEALHVPTETVGEHRTTRDVLYVCGLLAGDTVHILINHWPSKRGGESATAPLRKLAAGVSRHKIDSILAINAQAKIIVMGDFNDNPTSEAITKVMLAVPDKKKVGPLELYNPWYNMFKKGIGTEVFQGEWNMIDQMMISRGLLDNTNDKWKYYKHEIFNRDFLKHQLGNEKGLPHRSFTISQVWDNGYSDHFPIVMYLVEKI